jgi:preprotein translocase subunit YajC
MIGTFALSIAILQTSGGGISTYGFVIQMVLIFGIFYFLMIRPQQKQRKDHQARLMQLKRGDGIVTSGGIIGEVLHIKETVKDGAPAKSMDDQVTIKSGDSRLVVERGRIARITSGVPTANPAA